MKVAVQCPECGKSYRIGDESLGARAQCKSCGQTFVISMDETASPKTQKAAGAGHAVKSTGEARQLPKKIGQYVLRRKLGAGAMGEVYLAHDPDLDREVAIKILPESFSSDKDRLQRFLREARLAARVHHTNAVTVYQVGAAGGLAYIAMEYVKGSPLDAVVAEYGPLVWRRATQVVRDAAAGLSAAHKLGVFHRDVKPANLMLSSDATKVVDFGLARAQEMDSRLTQDGTMLGTPAYMAPEQWMGHEVDARSDLYSLTCTYWYLLAGKVPFDAPSLATLAYQHRAVPLPDPRDQTPDLPDDVCRILLRGAAKDPAERFQTADELVSELDILLACPEGMLSSGTPWADLSGPSDMSLADTEMDAATDDPLSGDFSDLGVPGADLFQSAAAHALPALQSQRKASASSLPPWVRIAAGGVAALFLLLTAVIIFSTKYGQVQITLNDDAEDVEITLDGDIISIDGLDEPLKLKVGEHDLVASSTDFETVTRSFRVKRNEVTVVDVAFVPKASLAEPPAESIAATMQPTVPQPTVPEPTVPEPAVEEPAAKEPAPEPTEPTTPSNPPTTEPPDSPSVASIPPTLNNSIGMKLQLIPAGEFMMGSSKSVAELNRLFGKNEAFHARELPQHRVRITKPFYLQTTEVTQGQWEAVMGTSPWKGRTGVRGGEGSDYAAMWVTWDDATEFCRLLSAKEGREYRLPTEAEWEYACRAGTTTMYSFGDSASALQDYAWFAGNAWNAGEKHVHRVGTKRPNAWGLYDMHGNVDEWCADWYDESYYRESDELDPQGPATGTVRVMRGDHFGSSRMRSSLRDSEDEPGFTNQLIGCRVAMTAPNIKGSETSKADDGAIGILTLPTGCAVAYSFERDTIFRQGSKQFVRDLSGNGFHGVLRNVAAATGKVGVAAGFAGKPDSFIDLPSEKGQYPANDFTIMAWVKGEGGTILNLNHSPCASSVPARWGGALFYFSTSQGGRADLSFVLRGHAGRDNNIQASDNSIPQGVWTHAAVTRERQTVTFYINGKRDRVHSMPTGPIIHDYQTYDSNAITLGGCRIGDPYNFGHGAESAAAFAYTGLLDEFYLFDRALSAREITDLYQRQ